MNREHQSEKGAGQKEGVKKMKRLRLWKPYIFASVFTRTRALVNLKIIPIK